MARAAGRPRAALGLWLSASWRVRSGGGRTAGSQVLALGADPGGDPLRPLGGFILFCDTGEAPLLPGCGRLPDMRAVPRGPLLHAPVQVSGQSPVAPWLSPFLGLDEPHASRGFSPTGPGVQGGQSLRMRRFPGAAWKPWNWWAASPGAVSTLALGRGGAGSLLVSLQVAGSPSARLSAFGIRGAFGTQAGIAAVPGWPGDAVRSRPRGLLGSATDVAAALGIWCHFRSMDGHHSWLPQGLETRRKAEVRGWGLGRRARLAQTQPEPPKGSRNPAALLHKGPGRGGERGTRGRPGTWERVAAGDARVWLPLLLRCGGRGADGAQSCWLGAHPSRSPVRVRDGSGPRAACGCLGTQEILPLVFVRHSGLHPRARSVDCNG